ncbi:hypothetical protein DFP72DRAFT_849133 [Ephemerocybe angulata]|uniref:XPG-I domain-containing protein n=1 Tax=Ephemerocybe angulata TaxID=980116 RepID=A0A8H6HWC4_9AGAR|nr:hypothetical protein DFP72DRAFT_849133 [Tulosesus angulatus]
MVPLFQPDPIALCPNTAAWAVRPNAAGPHGAPTCFLPHSRYLRDSPKNFSRTKALVALPGLYSAVCCIVLVSLALHGRQLGCYSSGHCLACYAVTRKMGRRKTFQGNPIEDLPSKTPTKKRARNKRRASSPLKMEPNFDTFSHTLPTGIDDLPVLYEMPQEDDLDLPESELNPILSKDGVPIKIPSAVQNALNDPEIVSGAVANTTLADSLLDLEDEAAQQAIARQQEMAVKKGTEPAYARQLERYETQWALREERRLEEAREKGIDSIFPWIEDEEKAYQRRIEEHGNEARDNALVYYLNLLRYLRTALLQDMAIMASQHPDLFLLHFAPFNTNSFREFASQSTAIINTVEGEAKANLKHLPEQYAASVSGALRSTMIKQEQHRHAVEEQNLELRRDMFELIQSLGDCLSAPKSKKRKFSESLVQRFTGASSKYITGLAPGPTMPDPPRPTKQVHLEPEPPAPSDSESLEIAPNPISSAQTPTAATTSMFSPKAPAISGSGTVYSFATFPLSTNLEMRATQVREISVLEKKLSPGQLKHNSFEWVENSPKQGVGEWIPEFSGYWKPPSNQTASLKDIWNENEYGIGHRFSIKQLRAHWGVRWRRNVNGLKVEGVRREKVVELVRRLIAQDEWDEEKALRFLEERCPIPSKSAPYLKNLRAFITYLGSDKNSGIQKINACHQRISIDFNLHGGVEEIASEAGSPTDWDLWVRSLCLSDWSISPRSTKHVEGMFKGIENTDMLQPLPPGPKLTKPGVEDTHTVLQPVCCKIYLSQLAHEYTVVEDSESQPHVEKIMRVGIDMGTFMDECVAGTHSAGLHHQFAGGPLRIFFFRLAQLLKIPANFVFVFDGPNKPEKRGHGAQSQPALWWVDDVQRLIESFGFYTHEAPGEAEAELALLNQWGMIDMMWTSDSDSMVFGGQTVLRAIPSRERSTGRLDELKLYTAEDVRNKLGLDRGRLILYSLVAGGDYGEGLHGGGMVSASEIALSPIGRTFGDLLDSDLQIRTLDAWRQRILKTLKSTSATDLGLSSRTRNLLLNQIHSFPSLGDLQSYLNPSTSLSHPAYLPAADNWFSIQQPDVSRIVNLCRQRLGWSRNSAKLRNVLRNNVWEGVTLRLALSNRCVWKRETSSFGTPSCRLQVKSCRTMVTKALNPEHEEECVRLGVNEADLIVETLTEEHRRFLELPVLLNVVKPTVIRAWLVPSLVPEWLLELCDPVKRRGKKRARSGQDQTGPVKQKSKVKGKGRKHDSPLLSLTELIFGTSPGTPEPSTAAGTSSLNVGPSCAGTSSLNVGPSCASAGASSSVPGTSSLGLMGSQGPAEGSSSSPNWLAAIGSNNSEVIDLTSTVSSEGEGWRKVEGDDKVLLRLCSMISFGPYRMWTVRDSEKKQSMTCPVGRAERRRARGGASGFCIALVDSLEGAAKHGLCAVIVIWILGALEVIEARSHTPLNRLAQGQEGAPLGEPSGGGASSGFGKGGPGMSGHQHVPSLFVILYWSFTCLHTPLEEERPGRGNTWKRKHLEEETPGRGNAWKRKCLEEGITGRHWKRAGRRNSWKREGLEEGRPGRGKTWKRKGLVEAWKSAGRGCCWKRKPLEEGWKRTLLEEETTGRGLEEGWKKEFLEEEITGRGLEQE